MMNIELLNDILAFSEFPFSVVSLITESGQRTAYKGRGLDSSMPVVIKVSTHNEIRVARIQREINILTAVSSAYFPRFYGHTFISNEVIDDYIDSLDLTTQKDRFDLLSKSRPRPFFVTCEEFIEFISWNQFSLQISNEYHLIDFLVHVFNALKILWDNKIVHRDIKPDNILIRGNLFPVIIDLGIAKSFRPGTQAFTAYGIAPLTPQYAAPEQFDKSAEVTYKVDQFAVGIIVYHMLTGEFPFGKFDEIGIEGLFCNFNAGHPKHLLSFDKNINEGLAMFIHRLIEVEPYKRFRNSEAIFAALSNIGRNLTC